VIEVEKQYQDGAITDGERYNKIIDIWSDVTERVADEMFRKMAQAGRERGGVQPDLHHGGFRRARQQAADPAARRHARVDAKPSGEIIETPITANFREGLTVLQYFISTHGARKGLADTALKRRTPVTSPAAWSTLRRT